MTHIFSYPTLAAPTATITLRPSIVTIQEERLRIPQRLIEAPNGTLWVFELATTRPQTYEVIVEDLQEANEGSFSGYQTLKAFFNSTVNWMMQPFDFTHTDGGTVPVRLSLETWEFTEGYRGYWSGRFMLKRIV